MFPVLILSMGNINIELMLNLKISSYFVIFWSKSKLKERQFKTKRDNA